MPALVTATGPDDETLTVEFVITGLPQQHDVHRFSALLSPLGLHEQGLPPSFWARPSKSRPGQLAYADKVTGSRYGTAELAWKVHLERVLRMECLPTVCETSPNTKRQFAWPASMEPSAAIVGQEFPVGEVGAASHLNLNPKKGQDMEDAHSTDVCFNADVFAELMAAPSPAAVPFAVFANADHDAENEDASNKAHSVAVDVGKLKAGLVCSSDPSLEARPSLIPQKQVQERVAQLEGALEESRERVKMLEGVVTFGCPIPGGSCEKPQIAGEFDHLAKFGGAWRSQCAETESARSSIYRDNLETASQSQAGMTESVCSEKCSAKESFSRVEDLLNRIVAEETLLKKAVEIAQLRQSAHEMSGNLEALEDREPRFAELQREIHERESKLLELSQVHQKKEEDLEKLRLSLQAREQANFNFERHLLEWRQQLGFATPVVKRQVRCSLSCGTPPKLPRAKPQALLASAWKASRSPSPAGSATVPACGAAGRAALQAAAELAATMARRAGPPRRASSVRAAMPCGTPERGRGFRTPRRSMSPTFASRGRGSPCSSVICSSIRSGCSTRAPSERGGGLESLSVADAAFKHQSGHYAGAFSHACFGSDDVALEVTLHNSSEGHWKVLGQVDEITVQRDGKNIVISDKAGSTTLEGHEVIGGILIGVVSHDGVAGGKFHLQPFRKPRCHTTLVKRTSYIPLVVPVWPAAGIPAVVSVQSNSEVSWRTTYQTAFP